MSSRSRDSGLTVYSAGNVALPHQEAIDVFDERAVVHCDVIAGKAIELPRNPQVFGRTGIAVVSHRRDRALSE